MFTASYSTSATNNNVVNAQICSDKGASLSNSSSVTPKPSTTFITLVTSAYRTQMMTQMSQAAKPEELFPTNGNPNTGFTTMDIVLCCLAFLILLFAFIFFISTWNIRKNHQLYQQHAQEL